MPGDDLHSVQLLGDEMSDAEISVRCDIAQRIYVSPSLSRGLIHN